MENFESQMVDKAMSNLPNVFTEVFTMQKGQTNDIQTLQQMVRENKVGWIMGCHGNNAISYNQNAFIFRTILFLTFEWSQ